MTSLNITVSDQVMVKFQDLPKGTWAKFRPLTMDYTEIVDFRAAFEAFLRSHYNTLTAGEILTIEQAKRPYQFVVEELKPANAVCITDTDLEVDIEPLDTDMRDGNDFKHMSEVRIAKEMKDQVLKIGTESSGKVGVNNYQRWKIDVPTRTSGIQITVNVQDPGDLGTSGFTDSLYAVYVLTMTLANVFLMICMTLLTIDVLVSTKSPVTLQDHIWSNFDSVGPRTVNITAADQDYATQQDSHSLHIGIFGRASSSSSGSSSTSQGEVDYSILVQYHDGPSIAASSSGVPSSAQPNENAPGYQPCTNCGSWIPERTMMLHTNFCLRNNTKCDKCGQVMKKEDAINHFHCDHCDKVKHATVSCTKANTTGGRNSTKYLSNHFSCPST